MKIQLGPEKSVPFYTLTKGDCYRIVGAKKEDATVYLVIERNPSGHAVNLESGILRHESRESRVIKVNAVLTEE